MHCVLGRQHLRNPLVPANQMANAESLSARCSTRTTYKKWWYKKWLRTCNIKQLVQTPRLAYKIYMRFPQSHFMLPSVMHAR